MDLTLNEHERAFRDELETWLADNHPGQPPADEDEAFEFSRSWQRALHAAGYAGIAWPEEFGGRGATLIEQAIYNQVTAKAAVPPPANFQGINNAGPAIILHGTNHQRERYLPPILSADEIWCQGFSEPEAGSDIAALKCRAVKVDGGWRLSGQKIWTSDGHRAQMCIVLARSNPDVPKHKGITYFLMEMDQPGVELRRIRQIDGDSHFNEMFLDDAYVADEDVLGAVGNGWNVAITTLMHERAGVGVTFSAQARRTLDAIVARLRDRGGADAHVRAGPAVPGDGSASPQRDARPLGADARRGRAGGVAHQVAVL